MENKRILLVEDDLPLADWIIEYLTNQDFTLKHVSRGDLVYPALSEFKADLILLDVMLPKLNGIEVCRLVRESYNVPIIMLTARADEYDEVIGLEAGANDYVTKPVRPRALLARINLLLKSSQVQASQSLELKFGDLLINKTAKRVIFENKEVELSTNLYNFLLFLAENAGTVVDREQVFNTLKGREYDGQDRRFDVMLSNLRKRFNDDPQKPQKFKTVWGKGYLFVADAWSGES